MPGRCGRVDTLTTHALENVDITSYKRHNVNVYSTSPTQQLSHTEMQRLGLGGVADALARFAGAAVRDYGGIGGLKTVSVRNLGAAHTAVSYDGITVSNTQAGQIDIGRFSLDNVSFLSFSVGQGNDLMQSARHYASAGIVEIDTETKLPTSAKRQLKLAVRGGSWGDVNPRLRYWQRLGSRTVVAVDGNYRRADGIYPFILKNGRLKTKERRINSDITSWQGEANLTHTFRNHSLLKAKVYYYKSERGIPGAVILYNNRSNERLWDEDLFVQASYHKRLDERWQLSLRGKYTHTWNKYEDTNVKYANGKMTDLNRQDEYYASGTLGWSPFKMLTVALAQDLSANTLHTNINGSPNPLRLTSLTALSARLSKGRVSVDGNIVGTLSKEAIHINPGFIGRRPADRHHLSPSLSASFRLFPDEAFYLRAMMKNTFRMPTFNDLYYLRIGNTSLRPEKANEYGVGLTWNSRSIGRMKYLAVTVDAYHNNVTDKIVAFPSTYIWKMANFGKVAIDGIDMTLATEIGVTKAISLSAAASFTRQNARDMTDATSQTYKSQLPYTPRMSGSASVVLTSPWITAAYSLTGQGRRYSMAQNIAEYEMKPYIEQTLSVSKTIRCKGCSFDLQATIRNLADKQYEIIKYYPMPGRSFALSAGLTL